MSENRNVIIKGVLHLPTFLHLLSFVREGTCWKSWYNFAAICKILL